MTPAGSLGQTGGQTAAAAPSVETVAVQRRDLDRRIQLSATVEGYETADLKAKIGGFLKYIDVDIGDQVEKGQVLAEIDVPEMINERRQKQALFEKAKADAKRTEEAIRQAKSKVTTAERVRDESETEKGQKRALLELAKVQHKRIRVLVEEKAVGAELLDEPQYQLEAAESALATAQARIRTAEAKVTQAKVDVNKAEADHQSAERSVDVAQANRDYVETMLQYAKITAPFDGVVIKRWVDPGTFIQPAEGNSAAKPLLTVARVDTVRISLDIPMAEVRFLDKADSKTNKPGDRAVLDRINALPGAEFEGQVTRFSRSLDLGSRMMRVEVDLPNSDNRLYPGYYGRVTLHLDEMPATPVIPASALLADDSGGKYVYTVNLDGTVHKRTVTTNFEDGTIVGIATGLEEGEEIVRAGGGQLSDGQKVTPVPTR